MSSRHVVLYAGETYVKDAKLKYADYKQSGLVGGSIEQCSAWGQGHPFMGMSKVIQYETNCLPPIKELLIAHIRESSEASM